MVTQALEAREAEFEQEHGSDTLAQLAAYVKMQFLELGHVPWPGEITGGTVIERRFGSWDRALAAAGLPRPRGLNKPETFLRVQEEQLRQKEVYRRRKAEKKRLAGQRRSRQAAEKTKKKD